VLRWTGSDREIACVSTGLPQNGFFVDTITDSDLVMTGGGGGSVKVLDNAYPRPNSVKVDVNLTGGGDIGDRSVAANDVGAIRQYGVEQWAVTTHGIQQSKLSWLMIGWSKTLLGLALARPQLAQLNVHPGSIAEPGDLVRLQLTHPDLWTYSTGLPGYTGPARVLGSRLNLTTGVKMITVMLEGAHASMTLCPSEQITAIGAGTPPAHVEIRAAAYDQFKLWFDEAGAFDVNVYEPGTTDEVDSYRWTISSVTTDGAGGNVRLYISAETGTFTATTDWWITVPKTATATDPQNDHAHTDTTGAWL
jgi:hypothetical protein